MRSCSTSPFYSFPPFSIGFSFLRRVLRSSLVNFSPPSSFHLLSFSFPLWERGSLRMGLLLGSFPVHSPGLSGCSLGLSWALLGLSWGSPAILLGSPGTLQVLVDPGLWCSSPGALLGSPWPSWAVWPTLPFFSFHMFRLLFSCAFLLFSSWGITPGLGHSS